MRSKSASTWVQIIIETASNPHQIIIHQYPSLSNPLPSA
jgi:hypothetical protein